MTKSLAIFTFAFILLMAPLNAKEQCEQKTKLTKEVKQPVTVSSVDIDLYLGTWYEQARIPTPFQGDCTQTSATYSLNENGTIKVANSCTRNGTRSTTIGTATPQDETNSKLKVRFPTSKTDGQYWIVRLDQYYTYAVVSNSEYSFLWILYRLKKMPDCLYRQIVKDLKKDGYPVEKLVKTVK